MDNARYNWLDLWDRVSMLGIDTAAQHIFVYTVCPRCLVKLCYSLYKLDKTRYNWFMDMDRANMICIGTAALRHYDNFL